MQRSPGTTARLLSVPDTLQQRHKGTSTSFMVFSKTSGDGVKPLCGISQPLLFRFVHFSQPLRVLFVLLLRCRHARRQRRASHTASVVAVSGE
eukprot:1822211-Rhodomonas_salina.2